METRRTTAMVRSEHERNVALTTIWEALHSYREELIPPTQDCYDEIWDEICFSTAITEQRNDCPGHMLSDFAKCDRANNGSSTFVDDYSWCSDVMKLNI